MRERPKAIIKAIIRHRDLFRVAIAGAAAASTAAVPGPAAAQPVNLQDKRRVRYQASSAEVQNFCRVTTYPARAFLKRSGVARYLMHHNNILSSRIWGNLRNT
jgi:hypothetical protein